MNSRATALVDANAYAWTVIEVALRDQYMAALDAASSQGNIRPFAQFIAASLAHEQRLRAENKHL